MGNLCEPSDIAQVGGAAPPKPVGRPNVGEQRRNEILDAAMHVILEHGIAGATRARIAEQAGVRPPAIHHFVGTQAEVLRASIERIGHQLMAAIIPSGMTDADPSTRATAAINTAFGTAVDQPTVNRLVDELVAHSYRDKATRAALAAFYRDATDQLAIELGLVWGPSSPDEARQAAAEITALAHAAGTFRHLGLTEQAQAAHRRAQQLALGDSAAASTTR
nr:HTH-type transcriptional regulator BetI-like [Nerophis lumbriciformis]